MSSTYTRRRGQSVGAAAVLLAALLSACGAESGSSSEGRAATDSELENYQESLDELYEGTFYEPTGPKVDPPADMNVWAISYGQAAEGPKTAAEGVRRAGEALGWDMTIFDGEFDPSKFLEGVQQAIVADADAIISVYVDCSDIKNGLLQAKEAGIPVVSLDSNDCEPALFDYQMEYADGRPQSAHFDEWGGAQARYVIAKTGGKANVLLANGQDLVSVQMTEAAQRKVLEEECPDCSVTSLQFTGADLGEPLSQKISQALLKDPEIDAFIAGYDAILTLGGAQAIQSAGRDILVVGGEGSVPGIQLIHDGVVDACAGAPVGWNGFASVDAVARILAGQDPSEVDTGIGVQVCDADHNLPPEGEPYTSDVDYEAAYLELWGK